MVKAIIEYFKKAIREYFLIYLFEKKKDILTRDTEVIDNLTNMPVDFLSKGNKIQMSAFKIVIGYDSLETLNRYVKQGISDIENKSKVVFRPTNKNNDELYFSDFLGTINLNNNLKEYLSQFKDDCIVFIRTYSELSSKMDPDLAEQKILKNYQTLYLQIGSLSDQLSAANIKNYSNR